MNSPHIVGVFVSRAGVPDDSITPVFSTWETSPDGVTWTPATPPDFIPLGGGSGKFNATVSDGVVEALLAGGLAVSAVIDCGVGADVRYLSWEARPEDWISPIPSVIPAPASSGGGGSTLILRQGEDQSVAIQALNADGSAMDLTGATVTFYFALGVPGGGQVLTPGIRPTALFSQVAIIRSPPTDGLADANLVAAQTTALAAGAGYCYGVKVLQADTSVVWILNQAPAEIALAMM